MSDLIHMRYKTVLWQDEWMLVYVHHGDLFGQGLETDVLGTVQGHRHRWYTIYLFRLRDWAYSHDCSS